MQGKIRVTQRPLPPLPEAIASDPRVSKERLADRGFANVRRIGEGVYATISDFSKGLEAVSNGGFVIGRDAALIVEAHRTPAGAAAALKQAFEDRVPRMIDLKVYPRWDGLRDDPRFQSILRRLNLLE